jgi:hypothetical protein
MSLRNAGLLLIIAALLFWLSWLLMPGVGVTDAAQIFELVGSQRPYVMLSVVTQMLSAALYVPALLWISCALSDTPDSGVVWSAGVLLLGAMGSAMDAIFHLLAYAMTKPGLERGSSLQVMAYMQGPGLRLVAPFILSFFVGGTLLSLALSKRRIVSKMSVCLYPIALGIALVGGAAAYRGIISSRAVGLSVLAAVCMAQAWLGMELGRGSARIGSSVLAQKA